MRIVAGSQTPGASPEGPRKLTVTTEEWELVWALREVAPGPVKETLMGLLQDVVAFVSEPACAEAQADGVPCTTASRECAQCRRVDAALALLRETLQLR